MIQDERRFCTFSIPDQLIETNPRLVTRLLNGFLILRCERSWSGLHTTYDAWHEDLAVIPEGQVPVLLHLGIYRYDSGDRVVLIYQDKEFAWAQDGLAL